MLINEVETVVGLSKKSIRYYEQVGLLSPKRNNLNDYRIYTEEDIDMLKKIKFLRELDVSIEDLKKLKNQELSLSQCLLDRIEKIEEYQKNYDKILKMCREISSTNQEFSQIDIEKYSHEMNILNKGGFTLRDISKDRTKRISGAIISSIIFILFFAFLVSMITYFQITETEKIPMIIYIFIVGILIIPMISIILNLVTRIKEIKGGEEDEASKY